MDGFESKTALVTGGGTSMGRAAALAAARVGVRGVGRRSCKIEVVAVAVEALGAKAGVLATGSSGEAQVESSVVRMIETFGRLDAAFKNAGGEGLFATITELILEHFDRTTEINLRGA
jgi:NAD(P)-dependent dehydrogenase (short-subunit alcohol dehydrogenase family)